MGQYLIKCIHERDEVCLISLVCFRSNIGVFGGQNRSSTPSELELQAFVRVLVWSVGAPFCRCS